MKVQASDYDRMRAWFAHMVPLLFQPESIGGDAHPLAALDAMAERSPAKAREGLSMAINDIIEMTDGWPAANVAALDLDLEEARLPSLSEVRTRFSKSVQRALRRGHIKDDVEYHAVRNAAEMVGAGEGPLWKLLAAYEQSVAGHRCCFLPDCKPAS